MKSLMLACAVLAAVPAGAAELAEMKTVYLLPMSRGLDQFLAQRLTAEGVLQVVTDPKNADVIFTDRIGSNFEQNLTELYAPPKSDKDKDKKDDTSYSRPAMQPLSRGKGNIFLVDRRSHEVIWSSFFTAKGTDSKDLNRIADDVADQLAKARKTKKKATPAP